MPVQAKRQQEAERKPRQHNAIERLNRQLSELRPVRNSQIDILAGGLGLHRPFGDMPRVNIQTPQGNPSVHFGSFRPSNVGSATSSLSISNGVATYNLTGAHGDAGPLGFQAGNLNLTVPLKPDSIGTFRMQDLTTSGSLGVLQIYGNEYRINGGLRMDNTTVTTDGKFTLQNLQINGQPIGNAQWDGSRFTSGPLNFSFRRGRLDSLEINPVQLTAVVASSLGTNTIITPFGNFDLRAAESLFRESGLESIRLNRQELERLRRGDTTFLVPKLGIKAGSAVANEVNRFMSLLQSFPLDIEDFKKQITVIVQRTPFDSLAYGVALKLGNAVILLRHTDAPYAFNFGILHGLGLTVPTNVSYTDLTAMFRLGKRFSLSTNIGVARIQAVGLAAVSVGTAPTSTLRVPVPKYSITLPSGEIGLKYNILEQLVLGLP